MICSVLPVGVPVDAAPSRRGRHPPAGQVSGAALQSRPRTHRLRHVRRGWASPAGQVALVGRDAELERLAAAAAAAAAGRGKIVLISGEPGIGKTALLTWLVDQAAAAGARIASGAAEELEMRVPFAAVSDCLGLTAAAADPKAAEIAAILHGAHRPAGGAFSAADSASLLVLHRLGRVAGQLPLLLAATRRPGVGPADLERLVRSWETRDADL